MSADMTFFTRSFFATLALVLAPLSSAFAAAEAAGSSGTPAPAPQTESWDFTLPHDLLSKIRLPSGRISDALFDWADDFSFFDSEAWEDGLQVNLRTQRRVFDNQDILNSWTVVDRIRLNTRLPIFSTEVLGGPIGFSIGTSQSVEVLNIRQMSPLLYSRASTLKERSIDLQSALSDARAADEGREPRGPIWDLPIDDPQDQARFGRFWNRVLFPMRLPLTANALKRLEEGEVVSYTGEGSVHLGPSVGWVYDNSILNANAGISVSTYLRGSYRISVLKESERFVRVKLTRIGAYGAGLSAGARGESQMLDGHLVLRKLNKYLKVTPFSLEASDEQSRTFNVGYRYDLENPQAREAYEQAVLGQFAFSDELSVDETGKALDSQLTGVQKLFTRTAKGRTEQVSQNLRLSALYRRDHVTSRTTVDAIITFPDGRFHIFQSWVENSREWRAFWAWYEKLYYKFWAHLNSGTQGRFPISLWAEGNIQDSSTSQAELMSYILEAENTIGKVGLFPRPPAKEKDLFERSPRSSFFYRIAFSTEQIQAFIKTSPERAWELLEQAFGVTPGTWTNPLNRFWNRLGSEVLNIFTYPLYVADAPIRLGNVPGHASRIHERWMNVASARSLEEMTERLSKVFHDRRYSYELMRLLRASMNGQPVAYEVSAYSPVFGRVAETGNSEVFLEDLATRAQREIEFDREEGRTPTQDRDAAIHGVLASAVSSSRVDIEMHLRAAPKAIYLELYERSFWNWKKKANVLVYNNGELDAGANRLVLAKELSESPWFGISKELLPRTRYRLRMAVNASGLNWGPAQSVEFSTR